MKKKASRRIEPIGPISMREWTKQEQESKGNFDEQLKSKLDQKLKEKSNGTQAEEDRNKESR